MIKIFSSFAYKKIIPLLGWFYIKFIYYTCRWEYKNFRLLQHYQGKKPFILCFWHSRLLMIPYVWQCPYPFNMLISGHKDGQLIARIIRYFNIDTIYGSSTKGGFSATRELLRSLKQGITIGITPDGPRGPRQKSKAGIYNITKIAEVDLIPVVYATSNRKLLKTWDRFHLPLPFGKGVFILGEPIQAPQEESSIEWLKIVEQKMDTLLEEADKAMGHL